MSRQQNPATAPTVEAQRSGKARRDKDAPPTLADFPIGARLLCEWKERNGYQVFLDCEVADAYESKDWSSRWSDYDLVVIVRVCGLSSTRLSAVMGRLIRLSLESEGSWWIRGPRWTRRPLASYEGGWLR